MCFGWMIRMMLIGTIQNSEEEEEAYCRSYKAPLNEAVRRGHVEMVHYLVELRTSTGDTSIIDLNFVDSACMSPLHYAIDRGSIELVTYLVEQGCDMSYIEEDKMEESPFDAAVSKALNKRDNECSGNSLCWEIVLFLLNNVGQLDAKGDSMMCNVAVRHGEMALLEQWLKLKSESDQGERVSQALVEACTHNKIEKAEFLMEKHHAGVNARDKHGYTPLLHATSREMCALLHGRGADVTAVAGRQRTALYMACESGDLKIIDFLVNEMSASVHVRDADGETPLFQAYRTQEDLVDQKLVVQHLVVEHGADPHVQNHRGNTLLHVGCGEESMTTIQYLVDECRLDVDRVNLHGETPLHLAFRSRKLSYVQLLLAAGANVNAQDNSGRTALHQIFRYWSWSLYAMEEQCVCGRQCPRH